jgi:hypothetical protein
MKKRFLSLVMALVIAVALVPAVTATANAVGDVLGDVLYSDILAFINGHAIPTSITDGKTMVVAEDLRNYGFDVVWDSEAWALRIEPNADAPFSPMKVERSDMPVGTFKMHFFYTNIKTYLSGEQVESIAVDGETLIDFEILERYGSIAWNGEAREIRLTVDLTMESADATPKLEIIRPLTQTGVFYRNDNWVFVPHHHFGANFFGCFESMGLSSFIKENGRIVDFSHIAEWESVPSYTIYDRNSSGLNHRAFGGEDDTPIIIYRITENLEFREVYSNWGMPWDLWRSSVFRQGEHLMLVQYEHGELLVPIAHFIFVD